MRMKRTNGTSATRTSATRTKDLAVNARAAFRVAREPQRRRGRTEGSGRAARARKCRARGDGEETGRRGDGERATSANLCADGWLGACTVLGEWCSGGQDGRTRAVSSADRDEWLAIGK